MRRNLKLKGIVIPTILPLTSTYQIDEEGSVVTFEVAWASNMESAETAVFFGSDGGLKLNPFTYYAIIDNSWAAVSIDLHRRWVRDNLGTTTYIDDFADACLEDREPLTPGADGVKIMQIISMAYLFAKLGREVTIEELKAHP